MKALFGTDGIRGIWGQDPITPNFFMRLSYALAEFVRVHTRHEKVPLVVVGRDTRASGASLTGALSEGLASQGVQVLDLGVVPTPAVPFMVRRMQADMGAMITASHNPADHNGVKAFLNTGLKLRPQHEAQIAAWVLGEGADGSRRARAKSLPVVEYPDALREYLSFVKRLFPLGGLKGMRIAVDAAHGSATFTTAKLLTQWGAEVIPLGQEPTGYNINDRVGSEHPAALCQAVVHHKAVIGFAHDGDADRLVVVDELGHVIEGEKLLGLMAVDYKRQGRLPSGRIVTTQASNAGLEASLKQMEIGTDYVGIGDRQLLDWMYKHQLNLGGESSGHFITHTEHLAGDGLTAALTLLQIVRNRQLPLSALVSCINLFPQASYSVKIVKRLPLAEIPMLLAAQEEAQKIVGTCGRILVRYSGTEEKIRLLAEAPTQGQADDALAVLRKAVYATLCELC